MRTPHLLAWSPNPPSYTLIHTVLCGYDTISQAVCTVLSHGTGIYSKTQVYLATWNATLFGNRVFVDIISETSQDDII